MQKLYRVMPLPGFEVTQVEPVSVSAGTDLEALEQAKQPLGTDIPFELWNGLRLALTYKPVTMPRNTGPIT